MNYSALVTMGLLMNKYLNIPHPSIHLFRKHAMSGIKKIRISYERDLLIDNLQDGVFDEKQAHKKPTEIFGLLLYFFNCFINTINFSFKSKMCFLLALNSQSITMHRYPNSFICLCYKFFSKNQ